MIRTIEVLLKDGRDNLIVVNVEVGIPDSFKERDELLKQVRVGLSRFEGRRWHAEDTRLIREGGE